MSPFDQSDEEALIKNDIHAFLDRNQDKELLRFVTVGSVDDGKSTLIGRLLHDTKGVYDDQLKDATLTTSTGETAIDFARITDGLRAEREQGITIDVAYRYFSTPRRKFIIADTPGHVQYTRNMATGASTAHVALILIDARLGVLTQSRRHAYIASLLGIPHLLVCVNKMDLADFAESRFEEIKADFLSFASDLRFEGIHFLPVSALLGVNVVNSPKERMPWYDGPTVLEFLETVQVQQTYNAGEFRFPVQYVIRPNLNYRGFAGQIVSGSISIGDNIVVSPSGVTSKVSGIDTFNGKLEVEGRQRAFAPMSVTLRLEDEIDISRGDIISKVSQPLQTSRHIEAMVVWMSERPLDTSRAYWIKHGTRYLHVNVDELCWKMDLETLEETTVDQLRLNDIVCLRLTTHRSLSFDPYHENRGTGAFILIDFMSNNTVGAGMIQDTFDAEVSQVLLTTESQISITERAQRLRQKPYVLSLYGKRSTEIAYALERKLFDMGHLPIVVSSNISTDTLKDAGLLVVQISDSAENSIPCDTLPEDHRDALDVLIGMLENVLG
jgi:bifunctional enzyme CysN/CysC